MRYIRTARDINNICDDQALYGNNILSTGYRPGDTVNGYSAPEASRHIETAMSAIAFDSGEHRRTDYHYRYENINWHRLYRALQTAYVAKMRA